MNWKKWLGLEMTPERFARKVSKLMQEEKPELSPVLDMENFRLLISEGVFFNLHNAYHAFQNAPRKDRAHVLEQFVGGMLNAPEVPATFNEVKPLLLPALRRKTMLSYLKLNTSQENAANTVLACRDIGLDCVLALAIDAERTMSLVMESKLAEWGVTFESALEVAMDNLRARSVGDFRAVDGAPGVICSNWCDAYDSSRTLLPDLMFRGIGSGNPVIMIPTRETLLLAREDNAAAQLSMLDLTEQALREFNRWCSTGMYQLVDGGIAVFEPKDAQVRDRLRGIERMVAMADYADQKTQLDKAYELDLIETFVASFTVVEQDNGIFSYCTWSEGVVSSLPKTDFVAVGRAGEGEDFQFVLVEWETLVQRHADLMQQTEDFPPRFHVSQFPMALFNELMAAKERETA